MKTTDQITTILNERETRYGCFQEHANIAQSFKRVMRAAPMFSSLGDDQHEAIEMILHKLARILNGDPSYADSWIDIAGYATLVSNRLEQQ